MTNSDLVTGDDAAPSSPTGRPPRAQPPAEMPPPASWPAPSASARAVPTSAKAPTRQAPARPSLHDKAAAPVIVKRTAPASVALAIIFWVVGLMAGGAAIVYLMVIRETQLEEIATMVRGVGEERPDETIEMASDIVFWSMFGFLVAIVLAQIVFLVSFTNRRDRARWWMFGSVVLLAVVFLLGRELVTIGDRGLPLERILLIELGLLSLGLLLSLLPGALRWTARKHDIRRGPAGADGDL